VRTSGPAFGQPEVDEVVSLGGALAADEYEAAMRAETDRVTIPG